MSQAVKCNLFLYADDTCLFSQDKDINKIEKQLNEDFVNTCDWFVSNKLSIHFGDDKTSHFDYACFAWYLNLTKKLKNRIHTSQKRCTRFCLQLDF